MIIFIPQDESNSVFIEKNLEFSVYFLLSVILNNSVVIKKWWLLYFIFIDLNIKRKWSCGKTSENTENMFHCSEK